MQKEQKYRAIFISDVHLGLTAKPPEILASFLKKSTAEKIYLVGDIIDMWKLKRRWRWPETHNKFMRKIMKLSKTSEVYYLPGNHDEMFRDFIGLKFGDLRIESHITHETADGKKMLVIHGDQFDAIMKHNKLLSHVGAMGYELIFKLNRLVSIFRRKLGFKSYWSFSQAIKSKVKNAVTYICKFEDVLADYAKTNGYSGVIAGHIHAPNIRKIDDILYCNCGDFVESLTVLVEHHDGRFEILKFHEDDNLSEKESD